jgi:hypothetical protein
MSGFTLDPRFLVKNTTTELGLTYRHYWGRDFYDNSRYNAWQIAITTNIFF